MKRIVIHRRQPGQNPDSGLRLDIALLAMASALLVLSALTESHGSVVFMLVAFVAAAVVAVIAVGRRRQQKIAGVRWRQARSL